MNLAFGVAAAVAGAACSWPAGRAIAAFSPAPGSTLAESGPADAAPPDAGPADTAAAVPAAATGPSAAVRPARRAGAILPFLFAAGTGGLAFAAGVLLHPAGVAVAGCWLAVCGLPLAAIDVRVRRLPDVLTGAAVAGVAAGLLATAVATGAWPDLARAAGGAAAVFAFFALLALIRPGSAGLGDAKLGLSTGALAAWFGWDVVLWSVFGAFLLAAVGAIGLLAAGRVSLRSGRLAFGPFLLAGCLAAAFAAGAGH